MELHYSSVFEEVADAIPDAPALIHAETVWTWQQFDDRSARLASALLAAGITGDSKVAIYLYNCSEWLEAVHATLKIRAVPVNVNYRYLDDELVYLIDDADAECVIFHDVFAARIQRARHRLPKVKLFIMVHHDGSPAGIAVDALQYEDAIRNHDPASRIRRSEADVMFTYTGGTTGIPKGVICPVGMLASATLNHARGGLGLEDLPSEFTPTIAVHLRALGSAPVSCPVCPLMHSSGLSMGALPTLLVGGSVVTLASRSFDPTELLATSERRGVTSMVIAGDAIARPLLSKLDETAAAGRAFRLPRLRTIMSAGVAWSGPVKAGILEHLPHVTLHDGCGSTEGGIGFRIMRKNDVATTNDFEPVPGLKILREDLSETRVMETGRIAVPSVSLGYYKDPSKTTQAFLTLAGQTYVMAGDMAIRNADNTITLLGRGNSVINTGGEKVFPDEVEDAIKTFQGVTDVIVVGTPHERFGDQVTAVVSFAPGRSAAEADVIHHVAGRLADYKVPKRIITVVEVPRHANGKPDLAGARDAAIMALANYQVSVNSPTVERAVVSPPEEKNLS
jgi:fatty-acyl-CoA synthase